MYVNIEPNDIIRSAFELPALPQSTVRLAGIVSNDLIDLIDVVQVVECDPSLTLKLLRVANSVYSSSSRKIGTVKEAVIRLGAGTILGLAVGSCMQSCIAKVIPGYHLSGTDFWRHSLAAAMSTDSLRSFSNQQISPLAFTAALLHDIGKLVLGGHLNLETLTLLERANCEGRKLGFQAETEILSLNHGEIGGIVAQHWGLPETVVKGIAFHHSPQDCDDDIGYVTHFANFVAHEVVPMTSIGHSDAPHDPAEDITQDLLHLGLSKDVPSKICDAVKGRLAEADVGFS